MYLHIIYFWTWCFSSPQRFFTTMWERHRCQWRVANLDRYSIDTWPLSRDHGSFSACHTDYTIYTCWRAFSSGTWNVTTGVRTPTSRMQALYTNVANQLLSSIRIKKNHYFKWSTWIKIWTDNHMLEIEIENKRFIFNYNEKCTENWQNWSRA